MNLPRDAVNVQRHLVRRRVQDRDVPLRRAVRLLEDQISSVARPARPVLELGRRQQGHVVAGSAGRRQVDVAGSLVAR